MFVRRKKNPSGVISVQVIDKSKGTYRVVKTIGSSSDSSTTEPYINKERNGSLLVWVNRIFFEQLGQEAEEKLMIEYLLSNIENILLNRTQLILNRVYNVMGFDVIDVDILRCLVITRLSQPMRKLATVDYLQSYLDEDLVA